MIVLVLRGGLGNQMYEYASAKAMAIRANTDVVLNTRLGFETDKEFKRQYCLDCFNIKAVNNRLLSFNFPGGSFLESLSRKCGFHILAPWYRVVNDLRVNIQDLKTHPDKYRNVLLQGTWNRTDEYFDDLKDEVFEDFRLIWKVPDVVKQYEDRIISSKKPVVALGIRLYQDVKDKTKANERQRPPQVEYVTDAMDWYLEKYGDVRFMVFTQVKEWFLENVADEKYDYEFVDTGVDDKTAIFDMYLFSQCHHYILTHSTFYAWGEKLNRNKEKDVIIPKNWSLTSNDNWIRI